MKIVLRPNETIQSALKRLKTLLTRSGQLKEMRRREFYEKPGALRRKEAFKAKQRSRNENT